MAVRIVHRQGQKRRVSVEVVLSHIGYCFRQGQRIEGGTLDKRLRFNSLHAGGNHDLVEAGALVKSTLGNALQIFGEHQLLQ